MAYEGQNYLAPTPGFDLDYPYQLQSNPSPMYSASTVSDLTLASDQQLTPPTYHISPGPASLKKQKTSKHSGKHNRGGSSSANPMVSEGGAAEAASKPKRVRTGCLTCRERHLKCDEGTPDWYVLNLTVGACDTLKNIMFYSANFVIIQRELQEVQSRM